MIYPKPFSIYLTGIIGFYNKESLAFIAIIRVFGVWGLLFGV